MALGKSVDLKLNSLFLWASAISGLINKSRVCSFLLLFKIFGRVIEISRSGLSRLFFLQSAKTYTRNRVLFLNSVFYINKAGSFSFASAPLIFVAFDVLSKETWLSLPPFCEKLPNVSIAFPSLSSANPRAFPHS